MSKAPLLVEMSVVRRCRRTFSSSTTQFSLLPVACSHFGASFCMTIMSELFTVAIVKVSPDALPTAPKAAAHAAARRYALPIVHLLYLRFGNRSRRFFGRTTKYGYCYVH